MRRSSVTKIPWWAFVPEPVARFVRVSTFVIVVVAVTVMGWGMHVRAQLTERMIDTGSAMLQYGAADRQDARRTLLLNGQEIHLTTGVTSHGIDQVLDYYERHCLEHDGGVMAEFEAVAADHPDIVMNGAALDPIIRTEREDRGVVACLYTEETGGSEAFLERFERYQASGDVSEIGDMRYIYAEQAERGTHFVVVYTDGPFVLRDMLPSSGDAPGRDLEEIGRPEGVRRFAQAQELGAPQRMTVYVALEGGPSAEALADYYRADFPSRGWRVRESGDVLAASRDGHMVTLVVGQTDGERAFAALLEAP